jgi:putative ABC transport system permease protein
MPGLLNRLRARLRNRRFNDDLAEELRLHEEMKREEFEASGLTSDGARASARRALGNVTLMRENSRHVWIAPWLESIWQDLRYGVRMLLRQPLHSLTAIAVLVLAMGMSTSLFTLLKATTFAPWPAREADRVVRVWAKAGREDIGPSVEEYRFIKAHARTLSGVAVYFAGGSNARIQAAGRAETYPFVQLVSSEFLDLVRARIQKGAGLLPEDDLPGLRRPVVLISDRLWRNYLEADPDVIGRTLTVDRTTFTIVGVVEPRFDGLDRPVDVWMPLSAGPALGMVTSAGLDGTAAANCCIGMVARVADGIALDQARQELQILHDRFTAAGNRKAGTVAVFGTAVADMPGRNDLDVLPMIVAALALILVLSCANVGNLQLARGIARRRELATRTAIGASRARVVRQLLVEGLLLAGIAGSIAIGVAAVGPAAYLRANAPLPELARDGSMIDWQVITFTAAICTLACLLFALAPALQATRRTIPLGSLDRGSTRRSRFQLRGAFLAVQVAVCTVLLIGAGLVTRAIAHAMTFDPGFQVEGVRRVSVSLHDVPAAQRRSFDRELLASLERDLDEPVAVANHGPFTDFPFTMGVALPGEAPKDHRRVARRYASSRYFEVLGIPLVSGRTFTSGATDEIVVNEAFARAFWRGELPLGQPVRHIDDKGAVAGTLTIVGVVRDAYLAGLEEIPPMVFRPTTSGTLITAGGSATIERIRATAHGLNPHATVRVWPLSEDVREYLEQSRFGATVAWAISLLGLLLASVGVLGVFAYAVEERRREIGIRLALGAARRQIVAALVITTGRGMLLGLAAGLLLSLACGPVLRAYLYGLHPLDPIAYGGVMLLLAVTGALATLVPARRACRVDPAVTLRED